MDAQRFGRVLGVGARQVARTSASAVDAALAPDPHGRTRSSEPERTSSFAGSSQRHQGVIASGEALVRAVRTPGSVRQLAHSLSSPVRRLSSVLWLEVTGLFFGLFALASAVGVWRLRGGWHAASADHSNKMHLMMTVAVTLLFAYFCVSSFVRARRRSRRV